MKQLQMKSYINALSEHQEKYLEKYESLKAYLSKKLPEISSPEELDSLRKRIKKEQTVLEAMYKEMEKIHKTLRDSKQSPASKRRFEKFSKKFVEGFEIAPPDCKPLFEQISTKKQKIKDENNPAEILKKLVSRYKANDLDLQAFNDFLMNPLVKSKIKTNRIFAAKVENLNKQIVIRYAQTIATIDQGLFLKIRSKDLFSPWAFKSSTAIAASTTHYNNIADYVSSLVLAASSMEERVIIVERWIWVAHYLCEELKDYSGCHAILTGLSRIEISRLSKTFASLSPESQDALAHISNKVLGSSALKPVFNAQQAIIPAMPLIQRDITFIADGNKSITDLESKEDKREEMAMRTGGGRKILHVFRRLQNERGNFRLSGDVDASLDELLRERLERPASYDSDEGYEVSKRLEPINNELETVKAVNFGKVFKGATPTNQPKMRQLFLEDVIQTLNNSLINNVSGFLKARKQEAFQMDENYVINWEKEDQELEKLNREKEAYVEVLQGYSTNEKNSNLLSRTNALIKKLEALDFKQIKMQSLETKLYNRLFLLKVEFDSASRFNPDSEKISLIIAELEKISELSQGCQLSPNFSRMLASFNDGVMAFKAESSPSEVEKDNPSTELEKPRAHVTHLGCRYSLLFAPKRMERSGMDEGLSLTTTAVLA